MITAVNARRYPNHLHTLDWNRATQEMVYRYNRQATRDWAPYFLQANVQYPPKQLAILAFKQEQTMEIWAKDKGVWHYIRTFPLTAMSGQPGPKLKALDGQIPEGLYHIEFLNPFSTQHLSMKIDYPNDYDRLHAKQEHRKKLGGDIYIHGKNSSAGCLAIGNRPIEDLFELVAFVGVHNTKVIIAPNDMRHEKAINLRGKHPMWVADLDRKIKRALKPFLIQT